MQLARERPGDAVTLWVAPCNGARHWLHLPERRDAIVARLRRNTHPWLRSTTLWAFAVFMHTSPIDPKRALHRRRLMPLRTVIGCVGFPLYFMAAFLTYAPSRFATVVGLLLRVPLLPVLVWRLLAHTRTVRTTARGFVPAAG